MNEYERCASCRHQRREHVHEGGACQHMSLEVDRWGVPAVVCLCTRFKASPVEDHRFAPKAWRP